MNYVVYKMSTKEIIEAMCMYSFVAVIVAYLFYDSFYAIGFFVLVIPVYLKYIKNILRSKRLNVLTEHFCKMMESIDTSISAGLSIENAFREALTEMEKLYGCDADIVMELRMITQKMNLNQTLEDAFMDFAKRSTIEDIRDFADIFCELKRCGGNMKEVIGRTVMHMTQKHETEMEIEMLLNGKMLEMRVMCIVPFIIITYLRISSGEFLDVLYHNAAGIFIMTVCLIVYVVAVYLSKRITNIEV